MSLPKPPLDSNPPTPRRPEVTRRRRDPRHELDIVLLLTFGGRYLPDAVAVRLAKGREA